MIGRLVDLSLRRRALVVVLALGVLFLGILQIGDTDVDTLPEFQPPVVVVQTEALGLSASEVEQLITVPLEADLLNGVAWLEHIRSESLPGLSSIEMEFEAGTDILQARQVVQERLTQAAGLPNVSRAPAMVQPLSSESRVMMIGLSSDDLSLVEMSVLARWTVRPFLMGVQGVANVSVWGQRERQLQVLVDQEDLAAAGVTLLDVVETTGNALWVSPLSFLEASTPGTGGFIDGPNQRIGIQHVLGIESEADLAAVSIEGHDNLTLGDVTTVVEDHQPLIGDAIVDEGPGLLLVVEKFPWSNTIDTTNAVEDALAELAPGLTGIEVSTDLFRPAQYLDRSIDNSRTAALIGVVLAGLVLFALLVGWRSALVASASIAVSLAGTGLVLFVAGVEVNAMVYAGIVLAAALVIDDAIGDSESIRQGLSARGDNPSILAVMATSISARRPALYTAAIIAIATVPVFVMGGAGGEFLPTVALALLLTLAISTIVASTVTPALSAFVLGDVAPDENAGDSWLMAKSRSGIESVATKARSRGGAGLVVALALVLLGGLMLPTLERDFVPDFQQTDLLIRMDGAPGTSLQASQRIATAAAGEIRQLPDVQDVGAHLGRAVLSDRTVNVNSSELWVKIDPDADYGGTIDAIQEIVTGYPGFGEPGAVTYSNDRIDDVLRPVTNDLVVRVYGENPETLANLADEMVDLVGAVDGTDNARALHPLREPAVQIEVDLDRAAEFEIKPGDVRRTAATLLSGIEVGSFFERQKVFEVVVWSPADNRSSVSSVQDLLIESPNGERVRLADIADVRVAPVENVILRDAVSRYIDVVADVSDRGLDAVEDDITSAVAERGLPFEYHVRILDDRTDESADQREVIAIALAVAIAVLLIMQAAFGSWRLALLLFVATPLALAGGLVTLAISGGTYSIGSALGLFAIYAITLKGAMSLLNRFDGLQLEEGVAFGPTMVARGLGDRLAANVASLLTIAALMLPLVFLGERAGLEVIRPLAIVLLGGLVTSAIVTLIILPALYLQFGRVAIERESFA